MGRFLLGMIVVAVPLTVAGGVVYWMKFRAPEPIVGPREREPAPAPPALEVSRGRRPAPSGEVTDEPIPVDEVKVKPARGSKADKRDDASEPRERAVGVSGPEDEPKRGADPGETSAAENPRRVPEATPAEPPAEVRDEAPRVAVLPFKLKGSAVALGADFREKFASALENQIDLDSFAVFDRNHLNDVLGEEALANSDLGGGDAVAAFQLEDLDLIVVGEIYGGFGTWQAHAKLLERKNSRMRARGSIEGRNPQHLERQVAALASKLKLRGAAAAEEEPAPQPADHLIEVVNPRAEFNVQVRDVGQKPFYVEGDYVSFEVTASEDCYVTLLARDPAGALTMLLPNGFDDKPAFVRKGKALRIPWDKTFRFPIQPPHGETIVHLIATRRAPLKVMGVNKQVLKKEKYVQLDGSNSKGIGVEGAGGAVGEIPDVMPAGDWATAEMVLVTRGPGRAAPDPEPPQAGTGDDDPGPTTPSTDETAERVKGDPNELLLERWQRINGGARPMTVSALIPPAGTKSVTGAKPPPARELLVFRRPKGVGAKAVGRGGEGGSLLGEMEVVEVEPEIGTKSVAAKDVTRRIAELKTDPDVVAVVPNITVRTFGVPKTRLIPVQWALHNDLVEGNDTAWHRVDRKIGEIDPPLIAVVDQGLNVDDPRLLALAWTNPGEVPGNGKDDDGNGLVDDVHGFNFAERNANLFDAAAPYNHGSMCSSMIAGRQTGAGTDDVIGIAPRAKIVTAVAMKAPSAATGAPAVGNLESILLSIAYVAQCGAKVINLSLGGELTPEAMVELNKIPLWDALERQNVVLVCAAGNDNKDHDTLAQFPSALPRSNVLVVLAVDTAGDLGKVKNAEGKWVTFSNYGRRTVHLGAPGSLVLGIPNKGQVTLGDGTSFAAPLVTGGVALVMGKHPDWDAPTVVRAVRETVRPCPGIKGKCVTGGTLDIEAALNWEPPSGPGGPRVPGRVPGRVRR